MKVSVEKTVEISDEQRNQLGAVIDERVKPKRQATRQEIKDYIWDQGSSWQECLALAWGDLNDPSADATGQHDDDDEDLIGGADDEPEDDGLI